MIAPSALFDAYSIEATTKDAATIGALPNALSDGVGSPAQVFVPYLHADSDAQRIAACCAVRAAGFEPVPHLSARRIRGTTEFDQLLGALRREADVRALFVIAGDIPRPEGPYADSLALIRSGLIEAHGFSQVGIAGHPDGHPDVAPQVLWNAMTDKLTQLSERGLEAQIVTQFSFDADGVLGWLEAVRERGVNVPVRIGIPGPTSVRTLLRYAARCGVGASAGAVAKYGLSLGRLLGNAGPDVFLDRLRAGLAPQRTGAVHLHLFPFGGFDKVGQWMAQYTGNGSPNRVCMA